MGEKWKIEVKINGSEETFTSGEIKTIKDFISFVNYINKDGEFDGDLDSITDYLKEHPHIEEDEEAELDEHDIWDLCDELSSYTVSDAASDYGDYDDEDEGEYDDTPIHEYTVIY